MEREIKFKAKRYDNNQWVEGYFYEESGSTYIIDDRQKKSILNRNTPHKVDPTTVCQYTGLKDCEGKKIWEHDIVNVRYTNNEVLWNARRGCFHLSLDDGEISVPLGNMLQNYTCKVIGSKFDKEV